MKRLLMLTLAFILLLFPTYSAYASDIDSEAVAETKKESGYDVDSVIENEDASVEELLRAILVCVRDLDLYVQFFVVLVFAIGLVYFVVLKPLRYFLL